MKKTLINMSMLVVLAVSACDAYKSHDKPPKSLQTACVGSESLNNNCSNTILNMSNVMDEKEYKYKQENKKELPEGKLYAKKPIQ